MINWTTYTRLDVYHHPMMAWPPPKTMISLFVPPPICYSSLICWLDPVGIFPFLEYTFPSWEHFSPFVGNMPCFDPHFDLLIFGDWWQYNQSKHKICKNWQIEPLTLAWMLTIIQWRFGLPLKPWSPFVPPPICYSSLICWLDPVGIFPFWNILFLLGNISPPLLGRCLALIHISPPLESNHLKGLAPKMSCKTI